MRHHLYLALLVASIWLPAHARAAGDMADLPPPDVVRKVLRAQPAVLAALADVSADEANRARLRAGSYEATVRVNGQRRRTDDPSSRFGEWDVGVERALRLPGKAEIDGRMGTSSSRARNPPTAMRCMRPGAACCAAGSAGCANRRSPRNGRGRPRSCGSNSRWSKSV